MKLLAEDTDSKTEAVLIEMLRRASLDRKIMMALSATRAAGILTMAGLRQRHPGESEETLRRRFADLWLGRELAAKAYGPFTG